MKTKKYYISFESHDHLMCNKIEISKTEFNRQLTFFIKQIEATAEDEETPVEGHNERMYEHDHYIERIYTIQCGCSYTDLIELECDEGYYFTPKSKQKKAV